MLSVFVEEKGTVQREGRGGGGKWVNEREKKKRVEPRCLKYIGIIHTIAQAHYNCTLELHSLSPSLTNLGNFLSPSHQCNQFEWAVFFSVSLLSIGSSLLKPFFLPTCHTLFNLHYSQHLHYLYWLLMDLILIYLFFG